ncbi:MAG: hypothetical protein DRP09_21250, partial [Candidatus Thorarchaeota archaeon]
TLKEIAVTKMKKKMKVGIAVLLCLAFLLGSAVTQLVIGLYPANVTTVWVNNPPLHEADYIIGVYNSTHYYAKNGTTGEIEFCGTNASQVIINTFSSISDGDTVYIKKGLYSITGRIWVNKSLKIFGDGIDSTTLYDDTSGFGKPWFTVHASHVQIEGITFSGNYKSEAIFHIRRYSGDSDISDITIRNCKFEKPKTTHDAGAIFTVWDTEQSEFKLYDITVENCIFTNDLDSTYDNVAFSYVQDVTIKNCWINLTKTFILYKSKNCKVIGNTFVGFNSYASLVIGMGGHIVSDNHFNCTVPIKVTAEGMSYNGTTIISGNHFYGRKSDHTGGNGLYIISTVASGAIGKLVISNNIFRHTVRGVMTESVPSQVDIKEFIISDNIFDDISGSAIYLSNFTNVVIEGNIITNPNQNDGQYDGITIKYSTNIVISSNIIQSTWTTKAYRGIRIYDSYNITITDSVIENCSYRGIIEESESDWNIIIGVRAVDSPHNIIISGANTKCHLCYNGTSWIS